MIPSNIEIFKIPSHENFKEFFLPSPYLCVQNVQHQTVQSTPNNILSINVCLDLHLETIMIVVCVEIMVKLWNNFIPNNIGVENLMIVDNPLSHDIICLYNDKYDDITTPRLSTISLRM